MRAKQINYGVIWVIGMCTSSVTADIYVDGNVSDWGFTVGDNNTSVLGSYDGSLDIVAAVTEDQDDTAGDGGYLGPQYGGQNYDAELLAVARQNEQLFVVLVTGQRPDNGLERFAPGDFLIETSGGTYGLEVGGGAGGSGGSSALVSGGQGSTYTLNGHGYTTGHGYAAGQQTAGSIWKDVDWIYDPIASYRPVQFEVTCSSEQVGTADYIYTLNGDTAQHAVIEMSMDPTIFGGEMIESITWRPSCGNDELMASSINVVPEPAAVLLPGIGSVLVLPRRRRG